MANKKTPDPISGHAANARFIDGELAWLAVVIQSRFAADEADGAGENR